MQTLERIRAAIRSRREELAAYQTEAALHQSEIDQIAADGVAAEWPDELLKYRGMPRDQLLATCPPEKLMLVADLQARDRAVALLASVQIEIRTSSRRLQALLTQLPDGEPEDIGDALDIGVAKLQEMVDDAASPVRGYAINANSLRTLTDGTGIGVVTLKLKDGTDARKAVIVRTNGQIAFVDSE